MTARAIKRAVLVGSLASIAAVAGACSLIVDDYGLKLPTVDASIEASQPSDAGAVDAFVPPTGCQNVRPPTPPSATGLGSGQKVYIVAVSGFTISDNPVAGFDLDGVCTCDSRDLSGRDGAAACIAPKSKNTDPCDSDGGVDNALEKQAVRVTMGALESTLVRANSKVTCGYGTILLAINGYNGLADDDDVEVSLLASNGLWDPHDAGDPDATVPDGAVYFLSVDGGPDAAPINCGPWAAGTNPYPPRFDGTDLWTAPPGTTTIANNQKIPVTPFLQGYVRGFTLVVDRSHDDEAGVSLVLADEIPLLVHSPVLTAQVVPLDSLGAQTDAGNVASIRLDQATIAGRGTTSELLTSFAGVPTKSGGPSCADPGWVFALAAICGGPDLTDQPSTDFSPVTCTSMSLAFSFSTAPATIGSDRNGVAATDASACDAAVLVCP